MSLLIANQLVDDFEVIPQKVHTILKLLPQAINWFQQAINDNKVAFVFDSYEQCLEQLSSNLHSSALIHLKNISLLAGIDKLLDLSANDLNDLYDLNRLAKLVDLQDKNNGMNLPQCDDLFDQYRLICSPDMCALFDLYRGLLGADFSDLYLAASFDDQLYFFNQLTEIPEDEIIRNSAVWALQKSSSLSDFSSYYLLHDLFDGLSISVEEFIESITPIIFTHMHCPVLSKKPDQHLLGQEVVQWLDAGNTMGFFNIPSALLNIALNNPLLDSANLKDVVNDYIGRIGQSLKESLAIDAYASQSGNYFYYIYELSAGSLTLVLDKQGCLSLYSDTPKINLNT